MKNTLLAGAGLAFAMFNPPPSNAAPYISVACQVAGQNVQNLVTQMKVHAYAKPNPADRAATSVWLHQGYALGMQEVLEVDQMILNCPRTPGTDLTAINADTTAELQKLQQRINAYDRGGQW
jgi:hypothetical protein